MAAVTLTADGCVNNNKFIPRRELCVKTHYISNFERLQTMTFIERSKTGFKLQSKKQWLRLSLRIIEYATKTCKKYFYTFRINQISCNYGERKKEQHNFYRQVKLCRFPSRSHCHIEKRTLPQCSANGVRKPSVLHARKYSPNHQKVKHLE